MDIDLYMSYSFTWLQVFNQTVVGLSVSSGNQLIIEPWLLCFCLLVVSVNLFYQQISYCMMFCMISICCCNELKARLFLTRVLIQHRPKSFRFLIDPFTKETRGAFWTSDVWGLVVLPVQHTSSFQYNQLILSLSLSAAVLNHLCWYELCVVQVKSSCFM